MKGRDDLFVCQIRAPLQNDPLVRVFAALASSVGGGDDANPNPEWKIVRQPEQKRGHVASYRGVWVQLWHLQQQKTAREVYWDYCIVLV